MHDMRDSQTDPRRLIARLALAGVALVLLVTASSAFLRLRAAGLGCAEWPACYGPSAARAASGPPAVPLARMLHRVSAAAAGGVVLAIALVAFVNRKALAAQCAIALALLGLTLVLALLGRVTPVAESPGVPMTNLLGGMLLASLLWWLALDRAGTKAALPGWLPWLSALALVTLAAQLTLGALTSTTYSALACTTLPDCGGRWWPQPWSAAEFDPLSPLSARDGPSAAVHLAHRYGALASAAALLALAIALRRRVPRLAWALAGLLALQLALGALAVRFGLPLALVLLHNIGAVALLLAAVAAHRIALSGRPRVERPVAESG